MTARRRVAAAVKLPFSLRMAAYRQARKWYEAKMKAEEAKKAKDKQTVEDQFQPQPPLEQPIHASITLRPLEVTAPVPLPTQSITLIPQTALDLAVSKLREQASKLNGSSL